MESYETGPIAVRSTPEGVRIGDDRPLGLTIQPVVAAGATFFVDVGNIGAVPHALITDFEKASWWLDYVFGSDVAREVARQTESSMPTSVIVRAAPAAPARPLLRFAKGLWLYRYWPLPDRPARTNIPPLSEVDERAIEAELGTLAWDLEDVLGGTDVAAGLLGGLVDYIDDLALAATGTQLAPRVRAIVRAVMESVVVDDATYVRLENLEAGLTPADESEVAATGSVLVRFFRTVRSLASGPGPQLAMMGGTGLRGSTSIAWGRVAPRTVTSAEDNVSWSFSEGLGTQGGEFTVSVPVHRDSRALTDAYFAAIYVDDAAFPEAVVELFAEPDGAGIRLAGTTRVPNGTMPTPPSDDPADVIATSGRVRVRVSSERFLSAFPAGAPVAATEPERDTVSNLIRQLIPISTPAGSAIEADLGYELQALMPAYEVDATAPWFRLGIA